MGPDDSETVGFIDVGTNSIHLLVVRFYGGTAGTPVFQDKETVRLGQSLYSEGAISQEVIDKSAMVVSRFAGISRDMGADMIVAVATCAAREASNSKELVKALSKDVDVKVIPGTEEARLIGLGVFGTKGPQRRTVEIDIGGGSTEIILAENGSNLFIDSLCMGAVRYAYGLGIDNSKKIKDDDYEVMRRNVDAGSMYAAKKVREIGFEEAVGSSGTFIALAEMCAARRGDGDSSYLTLSELSSLMKIVRSKTLEERYSVPGLGKGRADIIVAGGAIAEELMVQFGIERMGISTRGLKQGLQIDHLLSHGYTMFDTRDASVRALACRCNYDRYHAEAVCRNTLQIFDQAKRLGLHSMGGRMRNLLASAAILHDIGEFINYTNHNELSQIIIENSDMVGFNMEELHYMGLMARFHHKKFPGAKDRRLSDIPPDDALCIRQCSMFLKMGDVLDRHRNATVRNIRLTLKKGELVVGVECDGDPSMEFWRLEKLRGDFRKLFGLELSAQVIDGVQPSIRS